jgi:folate-binding protein YgfZ
MTTNYFYKNTKSKFLEISGQDSVPFIQNLITNDINKCKENHFVYSCLLTPQGKFFADFFIFKNKEKYFFEVNDIFYENFLNKLNMYKLRSNINIEEIKLFYSFIIFGELEINNHYEILNFDPRNNNIGKKLIQYDPLIKFNEKIIEIDEKKYHEILIQNKVPYSPFDLQENKSLLLENNFDNINAISWDKGCFVGQEITARMKYRALLKKQLYALELISGNINIGDKIIENEVNLGEVISKANQYIFCILKIELVKEKSEKKALLEIDSSTTLKFL